MAGTSSRSAAPRARRRGGARWQVALIAAMLAFWEGFPFSLFGMPMVFGYQLFAAITFASLGLYVIRMVRRNLAPTLWELTAFVFFGWCVFVSYNYSVNIQPQQTAAWLPAVFSVAPLLMIVLLNSIGATREDAESALFWLSLLGSLLVIVDTTSGLHLLDIYGRASAFSEGRTVIFKFPAVFGLVIAAMRALDSRTPGMLTFHAIAAAIIAYNITILTESRLAMLAIAVALVPIYFLCVRGAKKLVVLVMAPILLVPVAYFLIARYLGSFTNFDAYMKSDVSATFRQREIEFFARAFQNTDGLGFGFMSGNPDYDNILTFAATKAGYLLGTGQYGASLVDIGLYAALYQYGYVGFAFALGMTLIAGLVLAASFRGGKRFTATAACGIVLLAFLVSPLPANFFTLFATSHCGALLWFMAAQVSAERKAMRRTPARPARAMNRGTPVGIAPGESPRRDLQADA